MKFTHLILTFLVVCLHFTSCSPVPTELKRAESLIESSPDSALQILQHVSPEKYTSDPNKALYGLLWMEVLDKKILPLQPDSLLDFSTRYYQNHPDGDRLATCYLLKARWYKYRFQYEQAMSFLLKAQDGVDDTEKSLLVGRINFDMGDIYQIQRDYVPARAKFREAYNCFRSCKATQLAFYSLLYIGRTYHEAKDYRKSLCFFHRIFPQLNDSLEQGAILQEIGLNYYDAKQYDSAQVCMQRVISYPFIGNNKSIRYLMLADLYFDMNQVQSALYYAQQALNQESDIRTQKNCYRVLVNSTTVLGDIPPMKKYMKCYQDCSDSIKRIDTQTKASFIETLHYTKAESRTNKNRLWIALGLFLMGVLLTFVLIKRLKWRTKKEIKQTKETFIQQKAEIRKLPVHKKRAGLPDKVDKLKSEQALIRKPSNQVERELLVKESYAKVLHINDLDFFFHEMDTLFHDFVTKLRKRYPDLNEKQLMWCCLHLLKIPTHDMLILLDYKTDNSLKRMKNRLASRFGIETAASLGDFLLNIVSED